MKRLIDDDAVRRISRIRKLRKRGRGGFRRIREDVLAAVHAVIGVIFVGGEHVVLGDVRARLGGFVILGGDLAYRNAVEEDDTLRARGVAFTQPKLERDRILAVLIAAQIERVFLPSAVCGDVAQRDDVFVVVARGETDGGAAAVLDISLDPNGYLIIIVCFYRIGGVG